MKRSFKDYPILFFKGVAMGAADVVPGVSGGTIAFISGIYEEFIDSLKSIDLQALRLLFSFKLASFWKHINGNFLAALFLGIGVSIASLASLITYLLDHHPVLLWAFFFGLIIASVWLIGKSLKQWSVGVFIALAAGTGISFWITLITPAESGEASLAYVFLCAMVAICAMILPGISGSFILLLMGAYKLIIGTIKEFVDAMIHFDFSEIGDQIKIVGTFALGAIVGLLSFSRLLSWLFKKYHDVTIALLMGFLVGSLNKIWPWKSTIALVPKYPGEVDPENVPIQTNVLPGDYAMLTPSEQTLGLTEKDPQLLLAIGMAIAGFAVIFLLERLAAKKPE